MTLEELAEKVSDSRFEQAFKSKRDFLEFMLEMNELLKCK